MATKCTITIQETDDGKLHIMANIPDKSEKTIAAALTKALLDASAGIMNTVLGQNETPQRATTQ